MRSLDLGLYELSTNEKFVVVGGLGGWGRLGVIIESNLNRVRLSCCWVGVGLGCDNISEYIRIYQNIFEYICVFPNKSYILCQRLVRFVRF